MKAPERRKVYHLSVRVTADQRDWLERAAEGCYCGARPSDVVRALITLQMTQLLPLPFELHALACRRD